MDYNFTLFCLTVIAILALALGKDKVTTQALAIISDLSGTVLRTLRQLQERMIK